MRTYVVAFNAAVDLPSVATALSLLGARNDCCESCYIGCICFLYTASFNDDVTLDAALFRPSFTRPSTFRDTCLSGWSASQYLDHFNGIFLRYAFVCRSSERLTLSLLGLTRTVPVC